MKTIHSGKFVMLCISCIALGTFTPMQPYKNSVVTWRTEKQRRDAERYAARLGITLENVET